ncbi:exported hypothetical protein [Gammaproteobacteria bacterium]
MHTITFAYRQRMSVAAFLALTLPLAPLCAASPDGTGTTSFSHAGQNSLTSEPDTGIGTYTSSVAAAKGVTEKVVVSVAARPDLTVTNVVSPSTGVEGGIITGEVTLKNLGTVAVGGFNARFYLSRNTSYDASDIDTGWGCDVPRLSAGGTFVCTGTVGIPAAPGQYYLGVYADPSRNVAESNENNNWGVASTPMTVNASGGRPDLIVTNVSSPSSGIEGGTVNGAVAMVKNQGSASAGAFNVRFYLSRDRLYNATDIDTGWGCDVTSLAPGGTFKCSSTVGLNVIPQQYYLGAYADPTNQVIEYNDHNNWKASANPIAVNPGTGSPDLTVIDMDSPSLNTTLAPGDMLSGGVVATIKNNGTVFANPFYITFYLRNIDAPISLANYVDTRWRCRVDSLAAGATFKCSGRMGIPPSAAPGTYYLGAFADSGHSVSESDEENNRLDSTPRMITIQ